MTPEHQARLEAAGHRVASAEDFFGLDETDRQVVARRLAIFAEVRRLCDEHAITRRQLTALMRVSQTRIAETKPGRNADLAGLLAEYVALGGEEHDFGPMPSKRRLRTLHGLGKLLARRKRLAQAQGKTRRGVGSRQRRRITE